MPEINNTTSTNPTNKCIIQQTKLIHQLQAKQPTTTTPRRSIADYSHLPSSHRKQSMYSPTEYGTMLSKHNHETFNDQK
ncbi:hypothetical protein ACHAXS_004800 [Conticribra weissflogii]